MVAATAEISKMLDKHRYIMVDDIDWYDCIIDDFVADMADMGATIKPDDIRFSGFCSQGDGACWTGWVDVYRLIDKGHIVIDPDDLPYTHKLVSIVKAWINPETYLGYNARVVLYCKSNYCHDGTMAIDDMPIDSFSYLGRAANNSDGFYSEAQRIQLELADKYLMEELEQVREMVLEWARGTARDLYRKLEAEYYYLTSDEAVLEFLKDTEQQYRDYESLVC